MPQIAKGGKFIFGWSVVRERTVIFPSQVVEEYGLAGEDRVILTTGSKSTGGFTVSRMGLLAGSALGGLFLSHPELTSHTPPEGAFLRYKGRGYCRVRLHEGGHLLLPPHTMIYLGIGEGDMLLLIRGSNIAFVCGHRGPLVEKAREHQEIPVF
jgi:bifunctional DNA-binding transcriptional regulator/antitoxin component of YhaV-PrlF toxin-antitoxin module